MKAKMNKIANKDRRDTLRKVAILAGVALTAPLLNSCTQDDKKDDPIPTPQPPEFEFKDSPASFRFLPGFTLKLKWEAKHLQEINIDYKLNSETIWTTVYSGTADVGEYPWIVNVPAGLYELRVLQKGTNKELQKSTIELIVLQGFPLVLSTEPTLSAVGGTAIVNTNLLGGLAIRRTSQKDYVVLSSGCTHEGCPINPSPFDDGWICYCHGSTFNQSGQVTNGPADEPLPAFQSELFSEEGILLINE